MFGTQKLFELNNTYFRIAYLLSIFLFSCVPAEKKQNTNEPINIHASSDAATLNPVAARDELSFIISMQLYQTLTAIDFNTEVLVGVIATSAPKLSTDSLNNLLISYEIRPEASFDDGTSITAKDVAFSLKLNVCPLINNVGGANYYGFIKEIVYRESDPLKISFKCEKAGPIYPYFSGDFAILPSHIYDPQNSLAKFSYKALLENDSLQYNPEIIKYAQEFNAEKYASDPNFINGSGAYQLKAWNRNKNILIERKKEWWGEKLDNKNTFFITNAPSLNYEIINDQTTAMVALKSGKIDFLRSIPPKDYLALQKSASSINLRTTSINEFGYQSIGFNLNNPLLNELALRKSIAYLTPKKKIIDKIYYGQAIPTNVPLSPQRKDLIDSTLNEYEYNIEKSKQLLKEANWQDKDNNGVLEKMIGGKIVECKLTYHYNSGNKEREAVGLILKDELKKVGIELEVIGIEWSVYLQKLRAGEMQIFFNGTSSLPIPPDFKSSFHSASANGGRNYANYKNQVSDSLIEVIKTSMDPEVRKTAIKAFQNQLNQDLPYVFLLTTKEQIAYSSKLNEVPTYSVRPNFWPPELSWK